MHLIERDDSASADEAIARAAWLAATARALGVPTALSEPPVLRAGSRWLADGRVGDVTICGLVSHIYFTFGHRQV